MFIETLPKSMSTGHGDRHLWQTRAVVGDVLELLPVADRDAAPGLLLVQEGLDQERRREDLVARAVEQVGARHVRRARRLALAAAQAVLDRGRDLADVALLHDQRLVAHQAEARRVGVGEVGLQRGAVEGRVAQQLALVEAPFGIDAPLVVGEVGELVVGQELELGDADAVLARDHAVEAARQLHDARDRRVRGLQHLVVVAVDRDVGVHVAVAGVHVQRDPDAAAQHLARGSSGTRRGSASARCRRRSIRAAPGSASSTRRARCGPGAARRRCGRRRLRRSRGRSSPASQPRHCSPHLAQQRERLLHAVLEQLGGGDLARRRRPSRAAGCRSRRTPRGDRPGPACWRG